ncbi:MAG TPA: winged helix-turn-helix domain-containing protein [Solirubrobacterales bacterium]
MEHLRRLAVVFAVPIRLKIVTELYQREMSPKQFYEEFGGGSVARVAQHFERLRKTGWLRNVRNEGPGGARRGATETIYRATDLAFCDRDTWTVLPYSIRAAFSWNAFEEIAEQLRRPMEALTFQVRPGSHLTGSRLLLDQVGYLRVAETMVHEFAWQYEEQEDAQRWVFHTGEELFRVGTLLLAFESPIHDEQQVGPVLAGGEELMIPFPVRVSKVFEDEVCMQIIDEANRGEASVPLFHAKFGKRFDLDRNAIRRRFKKLVDFGWLRMVGCETGGRRRGAVEKFYRATGPAFYDEDKRGPWANVPDALASAADWKTFVQLSKWAKDAAATGTLNRRDDLCLALPILSLDQQGWENVIGSLGQLLALIRKEEDLVRARMRKSGETPIAMVAALGAFETPMPIKEP